MVSVSAVVSVVEDEAAINVGRWVPKHEGKTDPLRESQLGEGIMNIVIPQRLK